MENYKTRITVQGLRRAVAAKAKEPIGEGEVIALPFDVARSLLRAGAVELTDADVTVELDWAKPVPLAKPIALVKANDEAALMAALADLGAKITGGADDAMVELADVPGLDLLSAVLVQLGDGRLSEYEVAQILTPEQVLNIVARRLDEDAIDREGLRLLLGMAVGEGESPESKGEGDPPPPDQSTSDTPTEKPAARGKTKT